MITRGRCSSCGGALPEGGLRRLCPACLMRQARDPITDFNDFRGPLDASRPDAAIETSGRDHAGRLATIDGAFPRSLIRASSDDSGTEMVPQPASPGLPATPSRVGHLRLFGEIARGGMGAVLKGRDEVLGRELAVKVLLAKHRDDSDLVRRFVEEAQIGGQLQHPGIVPIYELGAFDDGRPFFAMKLVQGRTLAALLAERSSPADGLPGFLGIFEQVCRTVAYAHARGVIHRDLKPSNIMVGAFGEVQVMDWGLAKALEHSEESDDPSGDEIVERKWVVTPVRIGLDSDRSRAGSVLGTPAYMAPEQARGEVHLVDERGDVFALGAMLCEILTGAPAFAGGNSVEIQRRAARGDTSEALARLSGCGADAELVGLARDCLVVESAGRPRDADVVSKRINSYLAGVQERLRVAELERARAEARAAEERQRRKLQLALAASILALTTLGGLAFTYELHRRHALAARVDRRLAEARLLHDQAREQPDDVERWGRARAAIARVADALGSGAEPAPLAALRRRVQAGLKAAEADRALLARLVDIRVAQADDLDGAATDAAYAVAFGAAAGIDPDAGDPGAAGARIARRPASVSRTLLAALDHWAAVRRERDPEGPGWARLLAVASAADPDPDRDALRAALLIKRRQERLRRLRPLVDRADAGSWSADSLVLLGEALALAGDAHAGLAVLRRASGSHPGDARLHYALALMLERSHPSHWEDVTRAYAITRALQPELAGHRLAHQLEQRGIDVEAEAVWRDLIRRRPANGHHLGCYAHYLKARGRAEEAAPVLDRAIAALSESVAQHPDLHSPRINLGNALWDRGKLDEAIASYREAFRLDPGHMAHHPGLVDRMESRPVSAGGRAAGGDPAVADAMPGDSGSWYERAKSLDRAAHQLAQAGRSDESLPLYRQALAAARRLAALDAGSIQSSDTLGRALAALGEELLKLKRWPEAEPLLRECREVREQIPVDSWPRYYTVSALGEALAGLGRFAEAEPLILSGYEGVEARKETIGDRGAFYLGETRRRVAWLYDQWGKREEAAEWRSKIALANPAAGARPEPGLARQPGPLAEVEDLLKGFRGDRAAFFKPYGQVEGQLERGGPAAEAAARALLERKAELLPDEAVVAERIDEVAQRESPALVARWLLAIAKGRQAVRVYRTGHVAIGRLVVEGGGDPELVMAQMPILPGGYFAGEVGDLVRPLAFRAHGYRNLDVPLKGKAGDVVDVGTVTLEALPRGQEASLRGRVILDDPAQPASSVTLSVDVGPINTPHNGYSPRRRWPEPLRLDVTKEGTFAATGLSPTRYHLSVSARGHVPSSTVVNLAPEVEHDAGEIRLRSSDLGFYIGKPAPKVGELAWEKDYPTALKKARDGRKPLLVMMTAVWCGPCKMLEKETLNDPWIRHFLSEFVLVKAYEDREVEATYGMNGYPTLVFARSDGEAAYKTTGYKPPLPFAAECIKAFERLSMERPPELRSLVEAGVIPSR